MRRALGFIPLAPIALGCAIAGAGAVARDMVIHDICGRARRWYAEVLDEIEGNK